MKIRLIVVGDKPRPWVSEGFQDYARRLPPQTPLELVQIPAGKGRTRAEQGQRLLKTLREGDWVVAFDEHGTACDTLALAGKLGDWRMQGRDVALLVGGAEGLDAACLNRADEKLSLSTLTFPHELVRVIVVEQLYRAWTILSGHPYHRA